MASASELAPFGLLFAFIQDPPPQVIRGGPWPNPVFVEVTANRQPTASELASLRLVVGQVRLMDATNPGHAVRALEGNCTAAFYGMYDWLESNSDEGPPGSAMAVRSADMVVVGYYRFTGLRVTAQAGYYMLSFSVKTTGATALPPCNSRTFQVVEPGRRR